MFRSGSNKTISGDQHAQPQRVEEQHISVIDCKIHNFFLSYCQPFSSSSGSPMRILRVHQSRKGLTVEPPVHHVR